MASLIADYTDLTTHLSVSDFAAQKVFAFQPRAEKELRGLLTDSVYDELVTDLPGDDAAALNAQQAAFAEALLALHHSLSVLGFRIADEGGLVSSFGMGEYEGQLLSPYHLAKLEQKIYAKAIEAIADLRPSLSDLFTDEKDREAQYQGNGFGMTAVGPNPEFSVYNPRTGEYT